MVTLGAGLNASEVTLAAHVSDDERDHRQVVYAVNVRTGQARVPAVHRPRAVTHLVVPGAAPLM
ncbi:hypothetical protein GCM10010149_23940 [Nonomuraea roseoviolacea subsp. roseoviolacea]|uniref:Uncharacterized protein n=1 Tax=Nonomuraea roseoviolacea subsp. carminata TaxID=160689 RepID=A0ABT1JT50_9ACTN|nr:hypothetical protein [Nonomuraea roseoviolacea]MCP2344514.1 hypothetical protein [Nonomuraea roseoviolacea subsp. carminata]